MIALTEEIYSALSSVTPETYFHILPEKADPAGTLLVYELYQSSSFNSLTTFDYAGDIDLTVKLLNKDAKQLLQLGEQVKALLLNYAFINCQQIRFRNAVPIFSDPDLGTLQYTLNFIFYKSN